MLRLSALDRNTCTRSAFKHGQPHSSHHAHSAATDVWYRSSSVRLCLTTRLLSRCRYTNDYLTGHSSQLPCEAEYVQYQQCLLSKLNDDVKRELPSIDVRNPGSLDGAGLGKTPASGAQQKPAAGANTAA